MGHRLAARSPACPQWHAAQSCANGLVHWSIWFWGVGCGWVMGVGLKEGGRVSGEVGALTPPAPHRPRQILLGTRSQIRHSGALAPKRSAIRKNGLCHAAYGIHKHRSNQMRRNGFSAEASEGSESQQRACSKGGCRRFSHDACALRNRTLSARPNEAPVAPGTA